MNILFEGGQVYAGGTLQSADIMVWDGKIAAVGSGLAVPDDTRRIDAGGCVVSPGFIDLHTHLRQPGFEAKETMQTGTAAALAGGFTTVCSMPNLNPVPDTLQNLQPQLDAIQQEAKVRVLPYGAITVGEKGSCIADIDVMSGFVCGFTDDGRGVQDQEMMRRAMQKVAGANSFIAAHCELEALIPPGAVTVQEGSAFAQKHGYTGVSNKSEWAEVERDILLAEETGCRLHICHTSTAESLALVRAAKMKGLPVTCEITPHNLLLCCDDIVEDDGRFKMNPPLRTAADRSAAVAALLDGTADAIATDHAPHTEEEKAGGFAKSYNGVAGLETAFASLYTGLVIPGRLPLQTLLHLLTAGPAAVLGEKPNTLEVGATADLVLLNLEAEKTVDAKAFASKGRSTPFAGWRLKGWPVLVMAGGKIGFEELKK